MLETYLLSFPGQSLGLANQSVADLISTLRERVGGIELRAVSANGDTQDTGTILQIVLNAAAVASVASGVATWLSRNSGARIRILLPDGTEVDVKHSGEDTSDVIKAVFNRAQPNT
jgi:Effector Associated Constant Component 1